MTGAQLRAWRLRVPATQDELAAEMGVDSATISRLEQRHELERKYHLALAHIAATWRQPLPSDPE